jgi:hypothetical protein
MSRLARGRGTESLDEAVVDLALTRADARLSCEPREPNGFNVRSAFPRRCLRSERYRYCLEGCRRGGRQPNECPLPREARAKAQVLRLRLQQGRASTRRVGVRRTLQPKTSHFARNACRVCLTRSFRPGEPRLSGSKRAPTRVTGEPWIRGSKTPMLEEGSLAGKKGGLRMKKRAVVGAATLGLLVFALGSGPAAANQSGNAAVDCAGLGPPGQAAQSLGAAGSDSFQTPPELAASLGQESVGDTIRTFCLPPAG